MGFSDPSRREFIRSAAGAAAGVALGAALGRPAFAAGAKRPNIILIMADDLGYECLGCNGSLSYKTPHLDELAKTGVRFEHCHSQPLCTPSRVKIMTGRHNFRNYTQFGHLDPKEKTFGNVLKSAGYATCIVGKWQLGNGVKGPRKFGFDEHCLWQVIKRTRGKRYWNPTVTVNGKRQADIKGKYGPDVYTDHLLDFVTRHKDKPFFGYFPMCLTHSPFERTPDSPDGRKPVSTRNFADMVAYMDKIVGRIVRKLDDLGIRENTLVLFAGDNGSPRQIRSRTKSGGVKGGKGETLDTGTHVPLIANWKGTTPKGAVSDALIGFSDFLPTLANVAGAKLPAGVTLDGQSFLPILRGRKAERRDWLFCHYEPRHGRNRGKRRWTRDRRWKLYSDGKLFDVVADPKEREPVALDGAPAEAATARTKLAVILAQYRKSVPIHK
jgi:arylsulfatase A